MDAVAALQKARQMYTRALRKIRSRVKVTENHCTNQIHGAHFIVNVMTSRSDWSGQFSVVEVDRIRMKTL
jgi:hypothetical protein